MINELSIDLRLALEGYMDITPSLFNKDNPLPPKPFNIDYKIPLFINVLTLARNVVNANKSIDDINFIVGAMITEWTILKDLFKTRSLPEPILYRLHYDVILKDLKLNDKVRNINKETKYARLVDRTARATLAFIKYGYITPVSKKGDNRHIFHTHVLADLFYLETIVGTPSLLEGHTGRIRTKTTLFQRLNKVGKEPVPPLPFHPSTYALFGDKLIKPAPIKLRKEFIRLAEIYKWTPNTNIKRIMGDIALDKADELIRFFKEFKF